MDRDFVSRFPDWTFARFYHQLLIPIETSKSIYDIEEFLLFLYNAFPEEGVKFDILRPGDGKLVRCLPGSFFVTKYGKIHWIRGGNNLSPLALFLFPPNEG